MPSRPLFTILTGQGHIYRVHEGGKIERTDMAFKPSDTWLMRGLRDSKRPTEFIHLGLITRDWLKAHPLKYKNGKGRYIVCDLDHGTRREWGDRITEIWFDVTAGGTA